MATMSVTGAVSEELAERAVGSTLEGLREHRNNHICLEWGCRALRILIMDRYVILCHTVCNDVIFCVIQCVMMCVILCHTMCNDMYILCVTQCVMMCYGVCSTDQKKYMEMCLALFDLISILEQQDSDPILLGEAFAAITCLTDISMSLSPHTMGLVCYTLCSHRTTTKGGMSSTHLHQSVRSSFQTS